MVVPWYYSPVVTLSKAEVLVNIIRRNVLNATKYQLTPMDRATMPHARSTIALYTELDAECDGKLTIVVDC